MPFNPFNEKTKNLESCFEPWEKLTLKTFNNAVVSPYTKMRLNLAIAMESSALELEESYSYDCADHDIRRELSLIRRVDCHNRIKLLSLFPIQHTAHEQALILELNEISITAICAQNETNKTVKSSLNFVLVEDFDHLYRLSNLFALNKASRGVVKELGDWLGWKKQKDAKFEVMPGRPTISQHRFPYDDVRRYIDSENTLTQTKLNLVIASAAQSFAAARYCPALADILFAELASVEEQHVTHLKSLFDPNLRYIDRLIIHKFAECYVYNSLLSEESEKSIKALFRDCLEKKIAQINFARAIANAQERDYEQVLGDGVLPPPFNLEGNYERNNLYVRHVLKNIADNTQVAGEFLKANDLTRAYAFFRHNGALNLSKAQTASHVAVNRHIEEFGEDFRVEESPHPIAALRNRSSDNTDYAR